MKANLRDQIRSDKESMKNLKTLGEKKGKRRGQQLLFERE